jgi:hypothetical protein
MDIQSQVAARRVELARQRKAADEEARRAAAVQQVAAKVQRDRLLDDLAVELSAEADVAISQKNDGLAFTRPSTLGQIDPGAFRTTELRRMLWREARTEFRPLESILVVAGLSAGATLMFTDSIETGGLLVVISTICAWAFHDNHRRRLIADYPQLFGQFAAKLSGRAEKGGDNA